MFLNQSSCVNFSPVDKPSCSNVVPVSIKIDNKRSDKTRRTTTQQGAEVVSDAAGLLPVSSEDDQVTETNVTPQSCPLTVVKQTPDSSPNKSADTPQKITPEYTADQDGNESSSSRTSGRSKRQTEFYGSAIHHAVKEVTEASTPGCYGGLTIPVSAAELSPSPSPKKKNESVQKEQDTTSEIG